MTLDELRTRLSALDRELLELIAERQRLSRDVAEAKRAMGRPTRDFNRERDVLLQARGAAESLGVSPDLAESVLRLLIRGSLATQERIRVAAGGQGSGRTALVIGGGGKMGRWFVEFLTSQGYVVSVADPAGARRGLCAFRGLARCIARLRSHRRCDADAGRERDSARSCGAANRTASIFDVGSLKTPLRPGLTALREAQCKVTSIHPMFGPDTDLLSGRHVIFVDVGNQEALQSARDFVRVDDGGAGRDESG